MDDARVLIAGSGEPFGHGPALRCELAAIAQDRGFALVPYEEIEHPDIELPPRQEDPGYRRPPKESLNWIPTPY
jgi:hypothetical protein